jgi:hypothetical protein
MCLDSLEDGPRFLIAGQVSLSVTRNPSRHLYQLPSRRRYRMVFHASIHICARIGTDIGMIVIAFTQPPRSLN